MLANYQEQYNSKLEYRKLSILNRCGGSAMNENRNNLTGKVLAYEAVHGAGCAVVNLNPASSGFGDKEYDEDNVEVFTGERGVLDSAQPTPEPSQSESGPALWEPTQSRRIS